MKSLRLLALALLACAATSSVVLACDQHKNSAANATTASAVSVKGKVPSVPASGGCSAEAITYKTASNDAKGAAGCTAEMAAQCTPAMREACMKNAATAAAMGCSAKGATTATTASVAGNSKATGCAMHGATAAMANGKCDAKGTATAAGANCNMHGTTATNAVNMDHCPGMKAGTVSAAAAGMKCSAHQNAMAHDCAACEDWASCEQDVRALGAKAQVVALKNGAMIVYTADSHADVKSLQSVVAKRNERMLAALSAGGDQKLCDECKQLRGAMASGKLHREVVNVERGCMTLITSNDRGVVQKIRAMTGQPLAMK